MRLSTTLAQPFPRQILFRGYTAHEQQISPLYWPEEHLARANLCHDTMRHIGFLASNSSALYSVYEIKPGGSEFLTYFKPGFWRIDEGVSRPVWLLDQLRNINFIPGTSQQGLPPPIPAIPFDLAAWRALESLRIRSLRQQRRRSTRP